MADTTKRLSEYDADQVLQKAFNGPDGSITVNSFLAGKVGHAVERTVISPTIDDISFYDGLILLMTWRVTYDNADHDNINRAERTA